MFAKQLQTRMLIALKCALACYHICTSSISTHEERDKEKDTDIERERGRVDPMLYVVFSIACSLLSVACCLRPGIHCLWRMTYGQLPGASYRSHTPCSSPSLRNDSRAREPGAPAHPSLLSQGGAVGKCCACTQLYIGVPPNREGCCACL